MAADWMFDQQETSEHLQEWSEQALDALWAARSALERTDADQPSAKDEAVLRDAAGAIAEVRQRLRLIDSQLLGDAQSLLEEITLRAERRAREQLQESA